VLASPIYNKAKLALAARQTNLKVMYPGLGAGREHGFEQL
jgi:hypothetical protein